VGIEGNIAAADRSLEVVPTRSVQSRSAAAANLLLVDLKGVAVLHVELSDVSGYAIRTHRIGRSR
jgi:hypothetical protein